MHRLAPIEIEPQQRKRRPRMKREKHLAFIRQLPCAVCGSRRLVEAAHLRAGNRLYAKRSTGMQEKPGDRWATPLCRDHHAEQHTGAEVAFWASHGICDPWALCNALFIAGLEEDQDQAEAILREHRGMG